jgi:hypothetical protein
MNFELITIEQAAALVRVSPDVVRRWEKKGLIRAKGRLNGVRLFDAEEIKRIQAKQSGNESHRFVVLRSERKTKYRVIELFSGCGGMALGFENAGLQTELLVEIDKNAAATLRQNRPEWNILNQDISTVSFLEYQGKVDIVAGGFPCQAFSYAGQGRGFNDARGTLFFEFARCISEVHPDDSGCRKRAWPHSASWRKNNYNDEAHSCGTWLYGDAPFGTSAVSGCTSKARTVADNRGSARLRDRGLFSERGRLYDLGPRSF